MAILSILPAIESLELMFENGTDAKLELIGFLVAAKNMKELLVPEQFLLLDLAESLTSNSELRVSSHLSLTHALTKYRFDL